MNDTIGAYPPGAVDWGGASYRGARGGLRFILVFKQQSGGARLFHPGVEPDDRGVEPDGHSGVRGLVHGFYRGCSRKFFRRASLRDG